MQFDDRNKAPYQREHYAAGLAWKLVETDEAQALRDYVAGLNAAASAGRAAMDVTFSPPSTQ